MPISIEISGGHVPVKVWTADLEPQARRQLENVAQLPITYGHIAAMPDVHAGIGATVGCVIPTREAIIPAAVGVDIGCFTGDTEVVLADSKLYRLYDLAASNKQFVVYSCLPEGRICAAKATAHLTRRKAPLVEVTLDHGRSVRCTPDHQFMLRDGSYMEAGSLQPGASLMPFYSRLDAEGYFLVRQPCSGWNQRAHWVIARSGLLGPIPSFEGQKTVIHHENFNEADNTPSNLWFMGDRDHSTLHRLIVDRNEHWQSPTFEAARLKALAAKARTPDGYEFYAARGREHILSYMKSRPEHFRAAVAGNGQRGKKYLEAYNRSEQGRAKSREVGSRVHECPECGRKIRGYGGFFTHRRAKHGFVNHKVLGVRPVAELEDVYCLNVPGYRNFALAAGVFVHNCGMNAVRLSLSAADLPSSLGRIRGAIEAAVPVGFDQHPLRAAGPREKAAKALQPRLARIVERSPKLVGMQRDFDTTWVRQLGSLGGGNHFIELCLDEAHRLWVMLHSGSRGIGNAIGRHFIERARREVERRDVHLPDSDLAWLARGSSDFDAYVEAVEWAQDYALSNRREMLRLIVAAIAPHLPPFELESEAIECHHNYVAQERHFGQELFVTRKGAIRARAGEMGIIPGSMGAKSYIVRGRGNPESLCSCAHGAGRRMSRAEAKRRFSRADLASQTEGVECRKDDQVIDEIPAAYKPIDEVMANQSDLVEVVHTLKQVVCVKG